jgi:hypothetical protein
MSMPPRVMRSSATFAENTPDQNKMVSGLEAVRRRA